MAIVKVMLGQVFSAVLGVESRSLQVLRNEKCSTRYNYCGCAAPGMQLNTQYMCLACPLPLVFFWASGPFVLAGILLDKKE